VTPEELEDVRRRFQRNAHLLHTVLKASQVRAPSAERDAMTGKAGPVAPAAVPRADPAASSPRLPRAGDRRPRRQTHTTPVLAQLLLRMDFNRFLEQSQR